MYNFIHTQNNQAKRLEGSQPSSNGFSTREAYMNKLAFSLFV